RERDGPRRRGGARGKSGNSKGALTRQGEPLAGRAAPRGQRAYPVLQAQRARPRVRYVQRYGLLRRIVSASAPRFSGPRSPSPASMSREARAAGFAAGRGRGVGTGAGSAGSGAGTSGETWAMGAGTAGGGSSSKGRDVLIARAATTGLSTTGDDVFV